MTFDQIYVKALEHAKTAGVMQYNQRTKSVITSTFGYSFTWNMNFYPVTLARPMSVKVAAAEVAWMLSGEKSTKWLKKYTSIWTAFETGEDTIDTAYGYRWRHAFGVDQITNIIAKLKKDPTSRQQVLMSWDPRVDNIVQVPNIPCPYTAVVAIIDRKLYIHLTLRSNDVYLGLPYDVSMYTLLGQLLAHELGVEPGELFYSIAHMHLYQNQFDAASMIIKRNHPGGNRHIKLIDWTISRVIADRDGFVAAAVEDLKATNYQPEAGPPKIKVVV